MELPPWLQALRDAMSKSVTPTDIGQIMAAQVEKAKGGDMRAAGFVLRQVEKMTQSARPAINVVQNNFYDGERPDAPATEEPKTDARLERMGRRAAANLPLHHDADRPGGPRPMSDDEEKAFRRRQEAAAVEES